METLPKHYVYEQEVIDFVTIAVQTCLLLEHTAEQEKHEFVEKLLNYLPLLYLKTRLLKMPEQMLDGYPQTFVEEDDYVFIEQGVKQLLGTDDAYLEVFMEDMKFSDEPITAFISENLADIYQELKDMAFNYQQQQEAVMNDAVLACLESFREHWSQKLLNVLRALNALWLSEDFQQKDE
ncbi:MAG: DUF5063 domain-containing protein [Paludibacteraceae bacterium]|nr:DUF5063 domain-containing protein [Paludibacteraceae bacterium]